MSLEPAFPGGGTYAKASQSLHDRDRTVMRISLALGEFFFCAFFARLLMLGLFFHFENLGLGLHGKILQRMPCCLQMILAYSHF